jgi:NAD(P)-dependent dehydrogenase (short-subunit alcohol dehydrogenase family)
LLYRLSGDLFPLHADPEFARNQGFEGVIMSGPCTLGYASRALIKHLIPNEPERLIRIRNRFSSFLYPGIPIKTQIWKTGEGRAVFKTINVESGKLVLDHGIFEWIGSEEAARRSELVGIRFDGQVAVITGAGRGLGKVYALELAKRGAKIVVNDLGGGTDGMDEGARNAADDVVAEIKAAGGEAVANYDSVTAPEGGSNIIQTAVDHFGRVDILINNAGILRDKTFAKMEPEMWYGIQDVHLYGAYNVTRPAFLIMKEQGYGRIVLTTSAAGLFGNYGQTNYSAAKMGLIGFMNTLKLEGEKHDIKVNTISPIATTRLTKDLLPPDLVDDLKPEMVTPIVLYLCAEQCPSSGGVYQAGLKLFNRAALVSGPGFRFDPQDEELSPEAVAAQWSQITSLEGAREYPDGIQAIYDMASMPPEDQPGDKQ